MPSSERVARQNQEQRRGPDETSVDAHQQHARKKTPVHARDVGAERAKPLVNQHRVSMQLLKNSDSRTFLSFLRGTRWSWPVLFAMPREFAGAWSLLSEIRREL